MTNAIKFPPSNLFAAAGCHSLAVDLFCSLVLLISGWTPSIASPSEHLCEMEQLNTRQVHTLEVVGSSLALTILLYILSLLCFVGR